MINEFKELGLKAFETLKNIVSGLDSISLDNPDGIIDKVEGALKPMEGALDNSPNITSMGENVKGIVTNDLPNMVTGINSNPIANYDKSLTGVKDFLMDNPMVLPTIIVLTVIFIGIDSLKITRVIKNLIRAVLVVLLLVRIPMILNIFKILF